MNVPQVTLVVEGDTDVPFARQLLNAAGLEVDKTLDMGGKDRLDSELRRYNAAAERSAWFVLRDLDEDEPCAPALVHSLLPSRAKLMCLRIPVRSVEAWALGDSVKLAEFFKLREATVPLLPELEADPKQRLVNLARTSTSKTIRRDCVPASGAKRKAGPGYEALLIEFGTAHWRWREAQWRCPSLGACMRALRRLKKDLAASRA